MLSISQSIPKPKIVAELYCCLNITLRTGDGAEKLTSVVATQGVEGSISTRVMKEKQYSKAVLEDEVDFFFFETLGAAWMSGEPQRHCMRFCMCIVFIIISVLMKKKKRYMFPKRPQNNEYEVLVAK